MKISCKFASEQQIMTTTKDASKEAIAKYGKLLHLTWEVNQFQSMLGHISRKWEFKIFGKVLFTCHLPHTRPNHSGLCSVVFNELKINNVGKNVLRSRWQQYGSDKYINQGYDWMPFTMRPRVRAVKKCIKQIEARIKYELFLNDAWVKHLDIELLDAAKNEMLQHLVFDIYTAQLAIYSRAIKYYENRIKQNDAELGFCSYTVHVEKLKPESALREDVTRRLLKRRTTKDNNVFAFNNNVERLIAIKACHDEVAAHMKRRYKSIQNYYKIKP